MTRHCRPAPAFAEMPIGAMTSPATSKGGATQATAGPRLLAAGAQPTASARCVSSDLEPIRQLHQQLLAVAQVEGILELVACAIAAEDVFLVEAAAPHVSNVQVGQRGQFVAVTDLEAQVAQADVRDRFVGGDRLTVGGHAVAAPGGRVQA